MPVPHLHQRQGADAVTGVQKGSLIAHTQASHLLEALVWDKPGIQLRSGIRSKRNLRWIETRKDRVVGAIPRRKPELRRNNHGGARGPGPIRGRTPLDRKSTRLNSSHANISYAVFC